ncbi:hypothetical protein ACWCQQ_38050 [Streptomyces sp. NPDC002143]
MEGRHQVRVAEELGIDAIGPRLLILLEEVNATMKQLARYWERIRESGDPKISPAVDALDEVLYMGRQVCMHVLLVAQSATARALGGPEVREQFATRVLARYSMNAWRMLAPEVQPAPKSTKHPGRAQAVIGGTASETQVLFFTDAEAREWATTGPQPTAKTRPAASPQPAPGQLQKAADGSATVDDAPTEPEPTAQPALSAAQAPAVGPDDTTPTATSPTNPAAVDDYQVVGLRTPSAGDHHRRPALRPRQRPDLPRVGRQARS